MFRNKPVASRQSPKAQSSKKVFSYYSNNRSAAEIDRPRADTFDQKIKRSNRSFKYVPTYIALVVIVVSFGYTLILDAKHPKVMTLVNETNAVLRSTETYEAGIADIFASTPLNSTKLSINTEKLSEEIMKQYPELEAVSVNIPLLGKRPIVQISPSVPALAVRSQAGAFAIGSNGKVLMKLNELPLTYKKDALISVEDALSDELEVGETVLPVDTLTFINDVVFYTKQKGQILESVQLPAVANELHVKLKDTPYIIKYNLQNSSQQQAGSYYALIEQLAKENKPQPAMYVDVRIDGRVYYK